MACFQGKCPLSQECAHFQFYRQCDTQAVIVCPLLSFPTPVIWLQKVARAGSHKNRSDREKERERQLIVFFFFSLKFFSNGNSFLRGKKSGNQRLCFLPSEVSLPAVDGDVDRLSTEASLSLARLSLSLTDMGALLDPPGSTTEVGWRCTRDRPDGTIPN